MCPRIGLTWPLWLYPITITDLQSNMSRLSRFKAWFWPRRAFRRNAERVIPLLILAAMFCCCAVLHAASSQMTLTDQRRSASVPIDVEDVAVAPPVLEIEVTDLWNPSQVPLGIRVSMVEDDKKVPVGDFAFYPPDKKGTFHLSSKDAFARIGRNGTVHLLFELRKLRDSAEWKPVRVTLAPPKWLLK